VLPEIREFEAHQHDSGVRLRRSDPWPPIWNGWKGANGAAKVLPRSLCDGLERRHPGKRPETVAHGRRSPWRLRPGGRRWWQRRWWRGKQAIATCCPSTWAAPLPRPSLIRDGQYETTARVRGRRRVPVAIAGCTERVIRSRVPGHRSGRGWSAGGGLDRPGSTAPASPACRAEERRAPKPGPVLLRAVAATEPTVTDCNLLARLSSTKAPLPGRRPADRPRSGGSSGHRAPWAKPLGVDGAPPRRPGVIDVVNPRPMGGRAPERSCRCKRGHDPRAFCCWPAFGGSGGRCHAAALADELGIGHVICPPIPGGVSLRRLGLVGKRPQTRFYVRTVYADHRHRPIRQRWRPTFAAPGSRKGAAMLDPARGVRGLSARRFERSIDAPL